MLCLFVSLFCVVFFVFVFDVIACAMRVERVDAEFPAVVRVDEHQLRGDILHNVRDVMLMQQLHNRAPRRDGAYFGVAQDRVHLIDHLHRVALRRRHDRSHCCKNATKLNACSYYCVLKALQSWSHKLPRVCVGAIVDSPSLAWLNYSLSLGINTIQRQINMRPHGAQI